MNLQQKLILQRLPKDKQLKVLGKLEELKGKEQPNQLQTADALAQSLDALSQDFISRTSTTTY